MIIDNIQYCDRYYPLNKNFENIFRFLKTLHADSPGGAITEENIKGGISKLTEPSDVLPNGEKKVYEAHREAIDIHYIIDGEEDFGYASIDRLTPTTEYCAEKDCIFFDGDTSRITLKKGDFVIVFPEDAHIAAMKSKNSTTVKRAVIKVQL